MLAEGLQGGFTDAPRDAARAFRSVMTVMARPGRIDVLKGAVPLAPLSRAAGVLILTLCDGETPLYLAGASDTKLVRDWVRFHVAAPLVGPTEAVFAVGDWAALMPVSPYNIGTPDYPDRSTTLIVECEKLVVTGAVLTGPGIEHSSQLGLPDLTVLQQNAALFPLGLDFFFTSGAQVAALPRTTKVTNPCM